MSEKKHDLPIMAKDAWFTTTHWSVVLRAGEAGSEAADVALAKLCQTYWYPLYVFVRRLGNNHEDAKDLVQGFFVRVLEKNYLKKVSRDEGKFRTFLQMALKRFMANEWDRENRIKRGGGCRSISMDDENTEIRYQSEAADTVTPEKAFERQWALTLLERVLNSLQAEYSRTPAKTSLFEALKVFLTGEKSAGTYAEIGQNFGMTEGTVKVKVLRLRQRYGELLRMEIGNTVASPETIDDEIRHLIALFS